MCEAFGKELRSQHALEHPELYSRKCNGPVSKALHSAILITYTGMESYSLQKIIN